MNQREKKREEQELERAVNVLRSALRGIARRKAQRYEQEFLIRVRDMIDTEIAAQADANAFVTDLVTRKVKSEITKG